MSETPTDLRYAASHEWARRLENDIVEIGISDFAQTALGDVVYVELPEVGSDISVTQECCAVESVKAASDIYAPLSGKIVEVNEKLDDEPELLNESPYGDGWIFRVEASDLSELDNLLDADTYRAENED